MENKGSIEICANTAIAVMTVAALIVIAFPKGFAIKSPTGHKLDSRKGKEKKSAQ